MLKLHCRSNLANNPLYCDCGVGWMVSASSFPPLHSSSSSPPTCARPSQLAGRRVDSLSLDEIGCGELGFHTNKDTYTFYYGTV